MSTQSTLGEDEGRLAGRRVGDDADEDWAGFAAAKDAKLFCQSWLSLQCRAVGTAQSALLLLEDGGRFAPAAIWPSRAVDVTHLAEVAQTTMAALRPTVIEADAAKGGAPQVAYPIVVKGKLQGVIVLELRQGGDLQSVLRQLHWGAAWIETMFLRRQLDLDRGRIERTVGALEVLAEAGEQEGLKATAMAAVNELAARLGCRRVSLGLLGPRRIRLLAISNTAFFHRNSQLVAAIENAMEEAADQAASVCFPPAPETGRRIALAHRDLLKFTGERSAASVLLCSAGMTIGALTLEREGGEPFSAPDLEMLEAAGALLGPLVHAMQKSERLVAGRVVDTAGRLLSAGFGRGHLAWKAGLIAGLAAVTALAFAQGDFRVSASASIEGATQQAAVAPFEGYLLSAPRRAGDAVAKGDVLARIDDREFALEALRWRSERDQQVLKYDDALGQHDRSAAAVAAALVRQAEAQLALADSKAARSTIVAPYDGVIISGDLSQKIGTPVEKGAVLFEVAPADDFRVVLDVDERDLSFVEPGDTGHLVLAGLTDRSFALRIARITPVATTEEGRNVFRVEAEPTGDRAGLRTGMEGVAKIDIDRRSLLSIWSRPVSDWLSFQIWSWRP